MTTNTGGGIVQAAFEDAGLCALGQTVSSAQLTRGLDRLNDLMGMLATQGVKFWLNRNVGPITLVAGQPSYRIGPSGPAFTMTRPLQVTQAWYLATSGQRTPMEIIAKSRYELLSNTDNEGSLVMLYPNKQETYIDLFVYNTPDANAVSGGTLYVAVREAAPQVVIGADTTGFPDEWRLALRWLLADDIAVGQPQAVIDRCAMRAAQYKQALEDFDVEDAPVQFQMDSNAYSGGSSFR